MTEYQFPQMNGQLLLLFGLCFLCTDVKAQALPELPEFPSPSPARSPSPLPSVLQDIIDEAARPTAIPPGQTSGAIPGASNPTVGPTETPLGPQPSASPAFSLAPEDVPPVETTPPTPIPSPVQILDENGRCIRDPSNPQPILGKSQLRYAISVLLSAAAVGLATVFYGLASDWDPKIDHSFARLVFILIARLLTIGAVKVSAALVASITKASPDDGALDASGAFLTWGTAIFTRLYYEGLKMTLAALEFTENKAVWDDKLKEFLSEGLDTTVDNENVTNMEHIQLNAIGEDDEFEPPKRKISLLRRIFGGRIERKLLLATAVLYFASELSVLTANVFDLVGAFLDNPDRINFFAAEEAVQACINSRDVPILGGVIAVQTVYAITQQPSLVPLLTITAFCPECQRFRSINTVLRHLRWVSCLILVLWVTSLLVLPLFGPQLQTFFTSGDISLFWFVIIAPPSFGSTSYIITAVYTCLAAAVGIFIIVGISRSQQKELAETEDQTEDQTDELTDDLKDDLTDDQTEDP